MQKSFTMSFDNAGDLFNFLQNSNNGSTNKSEKNKYRKDGYPMPKMMKFIKDTNVKNNWTKLESFMYVNDKKINESFPENKKLTDGPNWFKNGLLFEKKDGKIYFTTYTILDSICVFNHRSVHKENGSMLSGSINFFYSINSFDCKNGDIDAKIYLDSMMDECNDNLKNGKFEWDIVQYE
jgi:hypothetical protein